MELIQKMSDPPASDCPACGKPTLKKKVSAAAFRLKGGGWYETDFKSGDKKKNLVENKGDNKGDKSKDTGGDSNTSAASSDGGSEKSGTGSKESTSGGGTSKASGDSSSTS